MGTEIVVWIDSGFPWTIKYLYWSYFTQNKKVEQISFNWKDNNQSYYISMCLLSTILWRTSCNTSWNSIYTRIQDCRLCVDTTYYMMIANWEQHFFMLELFWTEKGFLLDPCNRETSIRESYKKKWCNHNNHSQRAKAIQWTMQSNLEAKHVYL